MSWSCETRLYYLRLQVGVIPLHWWLGLHSRVAVPTKIKPGLHENVHWSPVTPFWHVEAPFIKSGSGWHGSPFIDKNQSKI